MKVGDKVKCIDPSDDAVHPNVCRNNIYIIESVSSDMVRLKNMQGSWFKRRFVLCKQIKNTPAIPLD